MAKETVVNFTAAQEAEIRAGAPHNYASATALAAKWGKKPRSVVAKIVRMEVPYNKQTPVTKTGEPVTRKETLVAEIGKFVPGNLDGLEKSSKPALQAVLATLVALSADEG